MNRSMYPQCQVAENSLPVVGEEAYQVRHNRVEEDNRVDSQEVAAEVDTWVAVPGPGSHLHLNLRYLP